MTITLYRNTHGITIDLTVGVDLTGNTALSLDIRNAAGGVVSSELTTVDAVAGIVRYVTKEVDLPLYGSYWLQVVVEFGASLKLRSEWVEISVLQ